MPTQCDHYWAGLRCQLWAGHASAHAAREDDALISWRSDEYGDRLQLDWADRQELPGPDDLGSADQPSPDDLGSGDQPGPDGPADGQPDQQ
jgi:hypothetical protein